MMMSDIISGEGLSVEGSGLLPPPRPVSLPLILPFLTQTVKEAFRRGTPPTNPPPQKTLSHLLTDSTAAAQI